MVDLDLQRKTGSGGPSAPLTPSCPYYFCGTPYCFLENRVTSQSPQLTHTVGSAIQCWLLIIFSFLSAHSQACHIPGDACNVDRILPALGIQIAAYLSTKPTVCLRILYLTEWPIVDKTELSLFSNFHFHLQNR